MLVAQRHRRNIYKLRVFRINPVSRDWAPSGPIAPEQAAVCHRARIHCSGARFLTPRENRAAFAESANRSRRFLLPVAVRDAKITGFLGIFATACHIVKVMSFGADGALPSARSRRPFSFGVSGDG